MAKSTGTVSAFTPGDRVFHQKFGNGNITAIDGNKLTIQFDRAGEKRVVDSFVERVLNTVETAPSIRGPRVLRQTGGMEQGINAWPITSR